MVSSGTTGPGWPALKPDHSRLNPDSTSKPQTSHSTSFLGRAGGCLALHQVTPVTRGERLASFFWVESMVRSTEQRQMLFDMDMQLLRLRQEVGEQHPAIIGLTGTYHNLLRLWADV